MEILYTKGQHVRYCEDILYFFKEETGEFDVSETLLLTHDGVVSVSEEHDLRGSPSGSEDVELLGEGRVGMIFSWPDVFYPIGGGLYIAQYYIR